MPPLSFRRNLTLQVPVDKLWPFLADTDRINRAVGLPPVTYGDPSGDGLVRRATARLFGLVTLDWDEPPFEWVENRHYAVRRKFRGGPLAEAFVGARATGRDGGTALEIFADVTPRHAAGALFARLMVGRKSLDDLVKLARRMEQALLGRMADPFLRAAGRADVNRTLLATRIKTLHSRVDAKLLQRLSAHLQEAFDEKVVRMRAFELADLWEFDRLQTLKAFLHAAKAGLLDVSWDILCPNCRVVKAEFFTLSKFKNKAHCEVCRMDIGADLANNVEVRFTVNPSVRKASDQVYCIGGPHNTPHRRLQLPLTPGEPRTALLTLPRVRHYLAAMGVGKKLALVPDAAGPSRLEVVLRDGAPESAELRFKPGEVELVLRETGTKSPWVVLDEEPWTDKAATAALVTTLQDFRDLFSAEVLSAGEQVSVQSLALLFTDLKGSTALYERIGDAAAYALVRDHFVLLMDAVRTYRGAVVKTIGDAVMAAFTSGEDALRAALAIQKRVHDFNMTKMEGREDVIVKLGIHQGPAIAVNSNDKLDYFGTTVNVAARVQNESAGGDVVVSRSIYGLKDALGILERRRCRWEPFDVVLKGLSETFQLWRVWPDPSVKEADEDGGRV
jgi:class 3 adenylate cyclase